MKKSICTLAAVVFGLASFSVYAEGTTTTCPSIQEIQNNNLGPFQFTGKDFATFQKGVTGPTGSFYGASWTATNGNSGTVYCNYNPFGTSVALILNNVPRTAIKEGGKGWQYSEGNQINCTSKSIEECNFAVN